MRVTAVYLPWVLSGCLGKQQPDKQYRLAPITETAAQATEAKGQKGKIAKRIFFPAALNCVSVLLLLSPDIDGHDGVLLGTAIFFRYSQAVRLKNVEKMLTTKDFSHAKSRDLAVCCTSSSRSLSCKIASRPPLAAAP